MEKTLLGVDSNFFIMAAKEIFKGKRKVFCMHVILLLNLIYIYSIN